MSKESRWYDEARRTRASAREQNPKLAAEATDIAFASLSDLNANERSKFWEGIRKGVLEACEDAPDDDSKKAAQCFARIFFKIGHAADGHQ